MKIKNLFAKGLVITAVASTLALGAGVAGVSASDGQHERNTSGSEHEQGSDHGHDDDGEENGRGHETHGQGWGFGHGTGEDGGDENADDESSDDETSDESSDDESSDDESGDDDSGLVVAVPVVAVPVVDVPVVDEPAVVVRVDSTPDTRVTDIETPAVAREIPASAVTTESSPSNPQVATETDLAIDVQPQVVIAAPEFAREVADAPATTTSAAAPEIAALEIAGNATEIATSGSLPMTGASSLVALGLAASLLAAGWLIIAGRRRNEVA